MTEQSFIIVGGDYEQAGRASGSLKEQLKRIGAASDVIRRVMIAAYEAEMNVVIHADEGTMKAVLDDSRVDVEVADRGPGIADIALAMAEGYSTAPAKAREFGFGAGLGLPNIRRSSDRFTIESTVGVGTRVCFTVFVRPQEAGGVARNSLAVRPDRCVQCLRCLFACPTRAIRLRPDPAGPTNLSQNPSPHQGEGGPKGRVRVDLAAGPTLALPSPWQGEGFAIVTKSESKSRRPIRPALLDYLCVDCGACIAACTAGCFAPAGVAEEIHAASDTVLVVPPPFLAQFGPPVGSDRLLDLLGDLGFGEVRTTEPAERALRSAVADYAAGRPANGTPILSPVCPAVLNLIATKFPSLLDDVAPFLSPMEAAREQLRGRRAAFCALCPAHVTAIQTGGGPAKADILLPATLAAAVRAKLAGLGDLSSGSSREVQAHGQPSAGFSASNDATRNPDPAVVRVTGMRHALNVLEMIENGLVREEGRPIVLEIYACDEGCFGSPLLTEDAFVSRRRWEGRLVREHRDEPRRGSPAQVQSGDADRPIPRKPPLRARPGLRLDDDMAAAIRKLAQIDQVLRGLPGKDCGLCGCPTCATLAEDIVLGRSSPDACVHPSPTPRSAP